MVVGNGGYNQPVAHSLSKFLQAFNVWIEKYGFPLISKGQSQYIRQAKHTNSEKLRNIRLNGSINGIGKIAERWKHLINAPFDVSEVLSFP